MSLIACAEPHTAPTVPKTIKNTSFPAQNLQHAPDDDFRRLFLTWTPDVLQKSSARLLGIQHTATAGRGLHAHYSPQTQASTTQASRNGNMHQSSIRKDEREQANIAHEVQIPAEPMPSLLAINMASDEWD